VDVDCIGRLGDFRSEEIMNEEEVRRIFREETMRRDKGRLLAVLIGAALGGVLIGIVVIVKHFLF